MADDGSMPAGSGAEGKQDLLSSVADPPKGEVTLSGNAGAFGPWRAHQVIDAIAGQVAEQVRRKLAESSARVLVVDDRAILEGDWTARQVGETLERLAHRIRELGWQIDAGWEDIRKGVRTYQDAEAPGRQADAAGGGIRRSADTKTDVAPHPTAGALPSGALSAATDLLSLLRTDYALVASTVTAGPAEIVTLTAAHLAGGKITVEADVFSTARASPSMAKFSAVLNARDGAVQAIFRLEQSLAPVEAELAAIAAAKVAIDQEWAKAIATQAAGDGTPEPNAARQAADDLAAQAVSRERVAGPARVLRDYARQVVADVDAGVSALLQAPPGGQAPLYTAARRERLAPVDGDRITHVLYVTLDCAAADSVTRRSVLGGSGILRFLAAGNASWLLLSTETGTVLAGGQETHGSVMTYGLASGKAAYLGGYAGVPVKGTPQAAGTRILDPSVVLEWAARALVVLLAFALAALGVLSVIAVIRVAIP